MSNETTTEKAQSATEMVLDEIEKKWSRVKDVITKLEGRLVVVLSTEDDKEPVTVCAAASDEMSPLMLRLKNNVCDIDWVIEKVERITSKLEV